MELYFALLFTTGITGFLFKRKELDLLCLFLMIFFTVFRGIHIGIDTYLLVYFQRDANNDYQLLQFMHNFFSSFQGLKGSYFLVLIYGLFNFIGIAVACQRFKVSISQALFFFILFGYWNLSLNIARQYAAIGFMLIAYSYLYEQGNKRKYFFLYVLLASGLHNSCLIFFLLYFIRDITLNRVKPVVLALSIFVFYGFLSILQEKFQLWSLAFVTTNDDMGQYANYFRETEVMEKSVGGMLMDFLILVINTYVLINLVKKGDSRICNTISLLFFIAILADVFFAGLYGNLGRFRYTIDIINIIAYAYYMKFKSNIISYLFFIVLVTVMGYSYYKNLSYGSYETVPYVLNFWLLQYC